VGACCGLIGLLWTHAGSIPISPVTLWLQHSVSVDTNFFGDSTDISFQRCILVTHEFMLWLKFYDNQKREIVAVSHLNMISGKRRTDQFNHQSVVHKKKASKLDDNWLQWTIKSASLTTMLPVLQSNLGLFAPMRLYSPLQWHYRKLFPNLET